MSLICFCFLFFFFKQKTAYEMRISDWSSDVCSSDLLDGSAKARVCVPVAGDTVAVVGTNRKLLVFELTEIPEMTRGKGVILQRYKSGGQLADVAVFKAEEGLSWTLQRSEEHTSELQSLMRSSYAVLCLKKKNNK